MNNLNFRQVISFFIFMILKGFLDANLPNPVAGLPIVLPDPSVGRLLNEAKADISISRNIKHYAQQQCG